MHTFTLDTNCIIAIDEDRVEAAAIRKLADAHASGIAHVALVAISASEKQRGGGHLESFSDFQQRLASLGLAHLELLPPMFYWDVTYWDWCIWSDSEMEAQEKKIHDILFPNIEFLWQDYCAVRGCEPNDLALAHGWSNPKYDVQALWSHIFHKREVFVTTDRNFHAQSKKPMLMALGANRIESPESAVSFLWAANVD
ncbi:MAG: hypothetical protein ACYC2E_18155 [Sulfuricella sp.]